MLQNLLIILRSDIVLVGLGQMVSSVAEEKKWNIRLTKSEAEFIDIMDNLNLPYPKFIGKISSSLFMHITDGD